MQAIHLSNIKSHISVLALIFINFLFLFKYLDRATSHSLIISIVISIGLVLLYAFRLHTRRLRRSYFGWAFCLLLIGLNVITHLKIPLESLNVDRWSIIYSFLDTLLTGQYPYYAKSNMGNPPGPMPVYFLVALPFYLIGKLSLLSSIGYLLLGYIIYKQKCKNNNFLFIAAYLLCSAFMAWEITTRSNIFTYSTLVIIPLLSFENYSQKETLKFYLLAVICGILLSTRSVFIIAYIIVFIGPFINRRVQFIKLLSFGTVAFIAFCISFAPLLLAFPEDFMVMNPFIVQSTFLIPPAYTIAFICLAFIFAAFSRNQKDSIFYSALCLFISILTYCIYHIAISGFNESIFNSKVDISYFIFCIPFFIIYLSNTKPNNHKTELSQT